MVILLESTAGRHFQTRRAKREADLKSSNQKTKENVLLLTVLKPHEDDTFLEYNAV
jgi:hypothetical protein